MIHKTIFKIFILTFVVSSTLAGCGSSNGVWSINRTSVDMLSLTSTLQIENTSTSSNNSVSHSESLNDQGSWKTNDNKGVWKMATSSYSTTANLVRVSYHDNSTEEDHGFSLVYPKIYDVPLNVVLIDYKGNKVVDENVGLTLSNISAVDLDRSIKYQNFLEFGLSTQYYTSFADCSLSAAEIYSSSGGHAGVSGKTYIGNTLFEYVLWDKPKPNEERMHDNEGDKFYKTIDHNLCYKINIRDDRDGLQKQREAALKTFKAF